MTVEHFLQLCQTYQKLGEETWPAGRHTGEGERSTVMWNLRRTAAYVGVQTHKRFKRTLIYYDAFI